MYMRRCMVFTESYYVTSRVLSFVYKFCRNFFPSVGIPLIVIGLTAVTAGYFFVVAMMFQFR